MGGTSLHGRAVELDELRSHARAVFDGPGRVVTLVGPAGVGKTALLQVAANECRTAGLRVLRARGTEAEQSMPFGVIRQLLERTVREELGTPGASGAAARGRSIVLGEATEGAEHDLSLGMSVYWLVADLAAVRPLALVVDDLHWADGASVRTLDVLRVRLADVPALLLTATRQLPAGGWAADAGAYQLAVRPLDEGAVAAVVAEALGSAPEELVRVCFELTGGNAFLLREVVRELRGAEGAGTDPAVVRALVPSSIVRTTDARLAALGHDAHRLARTTALLGDGVDLGRAGDLAELTPDAAGEAADLLSAAGVLEPARPLRFIHPLLLGAVRDTIPPRLRSRLHARAARLVHGEPGGLDTACGHLLQVDPAGSAEVVATLRRGAASAKERGASDAAVAYLRRALAEPPPRADVAAITGDLAVVAYSAQEPDAMDLARAAVAEAVDPVDSLAAAMNAGHMITLDGRPREATELILGAMDAPTLPQPMVEMAMGLVVTWSACSADARDAAGPIVEFAVGMAMTPEAPHMLRAVAALEAAVGYGTAASTMEMALSAWDDGKLLRDTGCEQPFAPFVCIAAAIAGDVTTLERWNERCAEDAVTRGSVVGRVASTIWYGWLCEARGNLAGAEAYTSEAIQLAGHTGGMQLVMPFPIAVLANARLLTAGPAAAEEALALLAGPARDPRLVTTPIWWLSRAAAELAAGRPGEALADLSAVEAWERAWPAPAGGYSSWRPIAARCHLALGDVDRARAVAQEGVDRAERFGAPRQLGQALHAAALVDSQLSERIDGLVRATDVLAQTGCGFDRVLCLLDLAEARQLAGDPDGAIVEFREALEASDLAGATVPAQRAMDALVVLGARPRRRFRSGALALTPSERRVVDLAAAERSNREIAEILFLTEKTVETHLSSAYRKLGIRSRTQLDDALTTVVEVSSA